MAGAFCVLASCSEEDFTSVQHESGGQNLVFAIADGGYTSSDASETRAVEKNYKTEFTAGDVCGLYIVCDGKVAAANIRLTAEASGEDLVWTTDDSDGTLWHIPGSSYYLYYPWQDAPTGSPVEGEAFGMDEADDTEFFAAMIAAWRPAADQSDYEDYTASDLMTAEGMLGVSTGGTGPLTFAMTHRMSMAVVEISREVDFISEAKPYQADGLYRYIVHPEAGAELTATYYDTTTHEFTISIAPNNLQAGTYKIYKVDGGYSRSLHCGRNDW